MALIKGSFIKYDSRISYEITDEMKDRIVERLLQYYAKHLHYGEGIHQDDNSLIEAPNVLSDICDDIIIFKEENSLEENED
jgi:hypothetical protein